MKSALVVGAACELGGPAIAGGGETDCCALAVTVASAQRQITSMKRFIRRASQQSWMKNQSNRFLEDSAPTGGQVAKICQRDVLGSGGYSGLFANEMAEDRTRVRQKHIAQVRRNAHGYEGAKMLRLTSRSSLNNLRVG